VLQNAGAGAHPPVLTLRTRCGAGFRKLTSIQAP